MAEEDYFDSERRQTLHFSNDGELELSAEKLFSESEVGCTIDV